MSDPEQPIYANDRSVPGSGQPEAPPATPAWHLALVFLFWILFFVAVLG